MLPSGHKSVISMKIPLSNEKQTLCALKDFLFFRNSVKKPDNSLFRNENCLANVICL